MQLLRLMLRSGVRSNVAHFSAGAGHQRPGARNSGAWEIQFGKWVKFAKCFASMLNHHVILGQLLRWRSYIFECGVGSLFFLMVASGFRACQSWNVLLAILDMMKEDREGMAGMVFVGRVIGFS